MSTSSRIISGSAASWLRIIINLITQIALVPIYLAYWDVTTYGIWIASQALISIITLFDIGHQNFLGYEFLKFGNLEKAKIAKYLWSGVCFGLFIGVLQVLFVVGFVLSGQISYLIKDINHAQIADVGYILIFQSVTWLISGSIGGIFTRALYPFGYSARMGWWGVWAAIITVLAPVVAVINGAGLLMTGAVFSVATIFYNLPLYYDLISILRKENLWFINPDLKLGYKNMKSSFAVSLKGLLENVRLQGIRIILAPITGASVLVSFTTMRTGANIVLQGLGTITNPIMPELMRFLNQKDQQKMEAALGTVWLVLVFILAPAVVVLQAYIEPFYTLWTRGQLIFDPVVFALLSLSVLVFALAQPAITIVVGNNILKPQIFNAAIAAAIVFALTFGLVPKYGILGAGIALAAAEIVDTNLYRRTAKNWLKERDLAWPNGLANIASYSIWIAGIASILMILFPALKNIIVVLSMCLFILNARIFWARLPVLVKVKVQTILTSPGRV